MAGGELLGHVGDDEAARDGVVALEVARARQGGRERLVRRAVVRSIPRCLAARGHCSFEGMSSKWVYVQYVTCYRVTHLVGNYLPLTYI